MSAVVCESAYPPLRVFVGESESQCEFVMEFDFVSECVLNSV